MENWTDIAEGHFEPSQDIEITSVLAAKKRPPNPSRFTFEKVNEATWKLTNGEMTNVPASPPNQRPSTTDRSRRRFAPERLT